MSRKTNIENPFLYGKVVTGKYFVNREKERQEIAREIEQHTNIILYSPRRYGKTSLVLQTFIDLSLKHKDFSALIVDFYTITSKEKFLLRLADEYGKNAGLTLEKLIRHFKTFLTGIVPIITVDAMGNPRVEIQMTPGQMPLIFEQIVNLPQKLAETGKLVAVFFDEFQETHHFNGQNFQKELRAIIQHHSHVSYIFSGSKHHLFETMFENPENPLYRIGKRMELGKIPLENYLPFLTQNLKKVHPQFTEKQGEEIYAQANGIPYYVQMLAHEVFNLAVLKPRAKPEELIHQAVNDILDNKSEEFGFIFEHLNRSERLTLEMLIKKDGQGLFKKDNQYILAPSTIKKALTNLQQKGIIERRGNRYHFQDIFFERWLRQHL